MQECYELSEFLIKATGLSMKLIKLIQCLSVVSRILVIRHLRNLIKIISHMYFLHSVASQTQFHLECILKLFSYQISGFRGNTEHYIRVTDSFGVFI